jgi:hypothetical protein
MQFKTMTGKRDKINSVPRWSTTALKLIVSAQKLKGKFYWWATARRALIVFEWMGDDGHNHVKLASYCLVQTIEKDDGDRNGTAEWNRTPPSRDTDSHITAVGR